jgi:hypothetical protein
MTTETKSDMPAAPQKPLSEAAQRALAEAAERRAALEAREAELARQAEINGRGGKDPVRYEDWEVKGIASDF